MSPLNWIAGFFAVVFATARLRSDRLQRAGLCERCGKRAPSETRLDVFESIQVCASCSAALSFPRRRLGSSRYANVCALVGALTFVAGWFVLTERLSFLSLVACGVMGGVVGGLLAWLIFPDVESA